MVPTVDAGPQLLAQPQKEPAHPPHHAGHQRVKHQAAVGHGAVQVGRNHEPGRGAPDERAGEHHRDGHFDGKPESNGCHERC